MQLHVHTYRCTHRYTYPFISSFIHILIANKLVSIEMMLWKDDGMETQHIHSWLRHLPHPLYWFDHHLLEPTDVSNPPNHHLWPFQTSCSLLPWLSFLFLCAAVVIFFINLTDLTYFSRDFLFFSRALLLWFVLLTWLTWPTSPVTFFSFLLRCCCDLFY